MDNHILRDMLSALPEPDKRQYREWHDDFMQRQLAHKRVSRRSDRLEAEEAEMEGGE